MRCSTVLLLFVFLACFARTVAADQVPANTKERFERIAKGLTHFPTGDIIYNRWSEPDRWPEGVLEAQQVLLGHLRTAMAERDLLRTLLDDADPRIRTLALGALFIREDPQDLPFIAKLMNDRTVTFTRLGAAATSQGGRLPLSRFEASQTVGSVSQEMLRFYLQATERESFQSWSAGFQRQADLPPSLFSSYWAERSGRVRCASWLLVKMRRATRQASPLQPQYEADVRRVLAEIDALPTVERAWTLHFVRTDQTQIDRLVPDSALVPALKVVGPDALMKFLRREPPTDDPDVLAGSIYPGSRTGFILDYAPRLLRARDADAVLATAEAYRTQTNNTWFVAAAARLRALENAEEAVSWLKTEIEGIPLTRTLGLRDQALLAFALWQIRGANERTFLANWVYATLTNPRGLVDLEHYFFRRVETESRTDTSQLFSAIVSDARFEQMGWSPLARILEMVNKTLPSPLVDQATIYRYQPSSRRADQLEVLATWRSLLRQHFGFPR